MPNRTVNHNNRNRAAYQVDGNTVFKEVASTTYYAHWEITEVFSVTVPVTLPLVVDEGGEVHVGAAEIINASMQCALNMCRRIDAAVREKLTEKEEQ